MKSIVWVSEIWDTRDLIGEVLDAEGKPKWAEWEGRFDPEDLNALEMALQIKDTAPEGEVAAISVGPTRKLDVLRECLYRGVDRAIRLVNGDNPPSILAAAALVAAAAHKLQGVDVIFTGVQLSEGQNAQKGAALARFLHWPLVSYVEAVEEFNKTGFKLRRAIEGGIQVVEVDYPVVISVGVALLKEDPRAPRSAKAKLKLKHKKTPITEWRSGDLEPRETVRSPSAGITTYSPQEQRSFPSSRVDGSDSTELRRMIDELRQGGLVR